MKKTDIFQHHLRVYIEDTDAGGIVFYVNYLKFMERARTEYMRHLGFGKNFIFNSDQLFVVKQVDCDYLLPAKLDDELTVTAKPISVGGSFIHLQQNVYRGNELLCKGTVKIVCVNRASMKPSRMPEAIKSAVAITVNAGS